MCCGPVQGPWGTAGASSFPRKALKETLISRVCCRCDSRTPQGKITELRALEQGALQWPARSHSWQMAEETGKGHPAGWTGDNRVP